MHFHEMAYKLVLAALIAALVGLERERRDRPAGLRTHIVVALGSTLITLVSLQVAGSRSDPGRIAAQIVSGIGFLGAGTIFRYGPSVRGLTTAAGIWTVAGIGMAIAVGGTLLSAALLTGALVFGTNMWLRYVEDRINTRQPTLLIRTDRTRDALARVFEELQTRDHDIREVEWVPGESDSERATVRVQVRPLTPREQAALTAWLASEPGVHELEWER